MDSDYENKMDEESIRGFRLQLLLGFPTVMTFWVVHAHVKVSPRFLHLYLSFSFWLWKNHWDEVILAVFLAFWEVACDQYLFLVKKMVTIIFFMSIPLLVLWTISRGDSQQNQGFTSILKSRLVACCDSIKRISFQVTDHLCQLSWCLDSLDLLRIGSCMIHLSSSGFLETQIAGNDLFHSCSTDTTLLWKHTRTGERIILQEQAKGL
jgi:hypothetical protein